MNFARQALMAQRNPAVRAAERRALASLLQGGRRYASMAASRVRGFAGRNPQTTAFGVGAAAQAAYAARKGSKRKRMKRGIARGRKIPRRGGGGKPPTTASARVPAKYAIAPTMRKMRKAKSVSAIKVPKSAIVHHKEFGQFNSEKCMYINHEHWGSYKKFWYGIGLGLTKKLLAYARIYNGKSYEDACIGPRTSYADPQTQADNKSATTTLRLVFVKEVNGATTRSFTDIAVEDVSLTPDRYRTFDQIATDVANSLQAKYQESVNGEQWLQEATILLASDTSNDKLNALPIYIQNLDDAEVHLYCKSLVKFQNITLADHAQNAGANPYDRNAIDSNPLIGRMYQGRGHYPHVDGDLTQLGSKTLDTFFGDVSDTTGGITLLGHTNTVNADDYGRIINIPQAKELYGNQSVKEGTIVMAPGTMKYHKTSFSMTKTFRALGKVKWTTDSNYGRGIPQMSSHTLFGLTLKARHGEDSIKIGWNRDTDVGCFIKHTRQVHPLKTNFVGDHGNVEVSTVPTEHYAGF